MSVLRTVVILVFVATDQYAPSNQPIANYTDIIGGYTNIMWLHVPVKTENINPYKPGDLFMGQWQTA